MKLRPLIADSNIIGYVLEAVFGAANFNPDKKKPSLGQRLLPASYQNSRKAITITNIAIWIAVVVLIAVIVALLS